MIRVFQLIFDPAVTWERIDKEQHSVWWVFFLSVFPLLLVTAVLEGLCLVYVGEENGPFGRVTKVPVALAIRYELVYVALSLFTIFGGAALIKKMGESFHSRSTYRGGFLMLSYSLGPLFLSHVLDGWPAINTWICFGIGILLVVSLVYRGIPRTLRPEPSNALGMYLFLSVFLIIATGLAHYVARLVLEQRIFVGGPPSILTQL